MAPPSTVQAGVIVKSARGCQPGAPVSIGRVPRLPSGASRLGELGEAQHCREHSKQFAEVLLPIFD